MDLWNCIKWTLCNLNWSNNPSYEFQLIGWSILYFHCNLMGQLCYCRFTLNNKTIFFVPCFNMFISFYYPGGFISKRLSETLPFSRKNVRKSLYPSFFYKFIYSFSHLVIHSFIEWFIYILVHWFDDLFIHTMIHQCIDSWVLFIYLFIFIFIYHL